MDDNRTRDFCKGIKVGKEALNKFNELPIVEFMFGCQGQLYTLVNKEIININRDPFKKLKI